MSRADSKKNRITHAIASRQNLTMVTQSAPFIGFCDTCNAQFRSYKPKRQDAELAIKSEFAKHDCKQPTKG